MTRIVTNAQMRGGKDFQQPIFFTCDSVHVVSDTTTNLSHIEGEEEISIEASYL